MPNGVEAFFFEECDSTNARAATLAIAGEQGPLWVVAGAQSAGRGRRGRAWTSETGNLYASLMFRPHIRAQDMAALPFIVALAVRDAFVTLGVPENLVQCKWPNDILICGRKASGVLIESSARHGGFLDYVIIGIGMNLMHFPDDAAFGATSLRHATGREVTVKEAVSVLAEKLYDRINAWQVDDFKAVADEWTQHSWGLGQKRELRTHDETFTATLLGLSDDGALIARLDDGLEKRLYAGDVFPVARAD